MRNIGGKFKNNLFFLFSLELCELFFDFFGKPSNPGFASDGASQPIKLFPMQILAQVNSEVFLKYEDDEGSHGF